ncbi:unnamed protein product [Rotaria sp. Silwood1]|nr:unnamed protein product [Rotaria sp. Silwood1]CAF0955693.1 unnamed protein product [Rotaria sp. Silwood1]CAF3369372.1 unnamed protein product [Rotaria sp. Silwood1]CAF3373522.1 unnamed protein product [Rotaria sp. Silwood1]CAF4989290.1 unnamed protein product [Rotaria sp. Silwood1]
MAAAIPRHLLETLVNCPSCLQRYTEPRVLPTCGHTICSICLENEWKEKYKRFCPVKTCRKEICSTINYLTDLPLNQTVLDLIKSCNFNVEANGKCQVCNQSPSFVKCSHCCLFVCFECANQHRRETLTTLTNNINTLEQEYLNMNDYINHAREKLIETRQKSLDTIRNHYTRLIEELRHAQITNEEFVERQSITWNNELELIIDEYKPRCEQISKTIQELRTTITDWSTIEQFKQLQIKLNHLQEDIREANEIFHEHLPNMKVFEVDHDDIQKKTKKINQIDSPSQTDELILGNGKNHLSILSGSIRIQHLDDSTSSASSSSNNEPVKPSTPNPSRGLKKNSNGIGNHYKSLNTLTHQHHSTNTSNGSTHHSISLEHQQQQSSSPRITGNHRSRPPVSNHSLSKVISNSVADLSLSMNNSKLSSTTIRASTFQSKLDYCNNESYKKIPLSQSYDWGILAITNTDLILLYSKDKNSLVIFDANGHENERIQWSDGEIKDVCIYHDDSIIIIGEHKQASSKPLECKLYLCNLTRKQLERERVVERGLNFQRVTSDEKLIFYGSEKGCNKSKISVFDNDLQLQITFEAGVEIRSLTVDIQYCYILGKRRERESGRYFVEKHQKNGQLVRRIDLYELNVDNMNRLIIDPISHGIIVTDGGNKKVWAIGPEGEKKSVQYRPWPWSVGFLTTDILVILHAGYLTLHTVSHNKQMNNGTKIRNIITNAEKV